MKGNIDQLHLSRVLFNIHGQIENRPLGPLENTHFEGRKCQRAAYGLGPMDQFSCVLVFFAPYSTDSKKK